MRRAFTLVELLVVMVILGIISVMLLPALSGARGEARKIQCVNNLRQHGIAWYIYLDENDSCFPYISSPWLFGGKAGSSPLHGLGAESRLLNKYLGIFDGSSPDLNIFHCPADMKENAYGGNQTGFDRFGNSYLVNNRIAAYNPSGSQTMPRPLSTITSPRNKVYLELCCDANRPGHKKGAQVAVMALFVDGHVAGPFLPNEDIETYDPNTNKPVIRDPNGTPAWED